MIACLATIMERTYADVKADFSDKVGAGEGLAVSDALKYLEDCGYVVLHKQAWSAPASPGFRDKVREEMLKPFAWGHILVVKQYSDIDVHHAVIMDATGAIHCPSEGTDKDYRSNAFLITDCIGVLR